MVRRTSLLLFLVFSVGCQRNPQPTEPPELKIDVVRDAPGDKPRAEVRVGGDRPDDWGHVPFTILKVYPNQKPIDNIPGHTDGGDWTFFDCRTSAPESASFTVGVRSKSGGAKPFAWGEAAIRVANRDEGAQLVGCLSRAFKHQAPKERSPQPLEPLTFGTAILGEGVNREPEGGFGDREGNWTATKWFLEEDGRSAEVFFNYNLKDRKGEFSEKDPDYREDLLAILSIALRDGPRPDRTPLTDPNLTEVGPKFGEGRFIARDARHYQFGPQGKRIIYASKAPGGATVLYAVAPDQPDKPVELTRLKKILDHVTLLDPDANRLLVSEILPKDPGGGYSSEDPKRLWWVDRVRKETRELKGPWDGTKFDLDELPVSPDGRFVIVTTWRPCTNGKGGNYRLLHIHNLESSATRTIELVDQTPDPVGWVGGGKNLRLVFLKNFRWEKEETRVWYLGDPETGNYEPVDKSPLPAEEWATRVSPDGKLVASIKEKGKLTVTEAKTGKTRVFPFHEDDQKLVQEDGGFLWVSPRYLLLRLNRMVFLDTETLKMSYPLPKKPDSSGHTLSPDFKWVIWQKKDEGLYVSPVILPPESP
jgi:hypothetical protein